jgi:glycogen phosphorylase
MRVSTYGKNDGARDLQRAVGELVDRLPEPLAPLARLVFNYRWTWLAGGTALFRDIDPHLWSRSGCNPLWMVESIAPSRLRALSEDEGYVACVERAAARLDEELARPAMRLGRDLLGPVAYFCSEFGAHCSLPLYGGGLGVLAGDVLKGASDRALPLLGVGLLYTEGYFHQHLDFEGWQREYWTPTRFERLPAVRVTREDGEPLSVSLPLRGREVQLHVWRVDFGRVPLFLLDANHPGNHPIDRWITHRLYIGDRHTRLAQYGALGVGGQRALEAMGIRPCITHLNEGHAALGTLERIAWLMREGMSFDAALETAREQTVFTTHTPVAAGNEWYRREELQPVLGDWCRGLGLEAEDLRRLGGFEPESPDDPMAITLLALRTSRIANGVSRRHGQVSRQMWHRVWPDRAVEQVPITSVTNGVHTATWMAEAMQSLLDTHLGPDWRERLIDPELWSDVTRIPDAELWAVRCALRARLVDRAREQSVLDRLRRGEAPEYVEAADKVFHPDYLTIGFARRVATYKRLHLLTRRLDDGLRLLADTERPIQMVIGGKAHPQDHEAKETLRGLLALRHHANVGGRIVFLENYDLHVAPSLVAGVDLWLNLPRPPLEASGTSGMKVAVNGGLNLSILDGWWEEAYDGESGWGISSPDADAEAQDDRDAAAVFNLLESEVLPLFYDRGADGIPHRWLARVKTSMARLIPRFSVDRMLRDYATHLYAPPDRSRATS